MNLGCQASLHARTITEQETAKCRMFGGVFVAVKHEKSLRPTTVPTTQKDPQ